MDNKDLGRDSMTDFQLTDLEFIPLCDLLKRLGLCENGGHAKAVIADGEVKVNGVVELRKRFKVRSGHLIEFNDEQIKVIE